VDQAYHYCILAITEHLRAWWQTSPSGSNPGCLALHAAAEGEQGQAEQHGAGQAQDAL
jgi:hypothetical protein